MHDPLTEAFRFPAPFAKRDTRFERWRRPWFVIWHRDPESDGSDDSCGWFAPKVPKDVAESLEKESAYDEHELFLMLSGYRLALRHRRSWFRHPRWHVHHWRIQVPAFQALKRARERCCLCHERFGMRPGGVVRDGRGISHFSHHIAQAANGG